MSLLPFANWIYNLPQMREEVNSKHKETMDLEGEVQADVLAFNKQLDKFRVIVANNAVLVYMKQVIMMDDLALKDFTTQIDALPPPVEGNVVLNFLGGVTELIGGVLVLKAVVNLGKLAKNKIWNSSGTAGETEAVSTELEAETTNLTKALGDVADDSGIVSDSTEIAVDSLEKTGGEALETAGEEAAEVIIESSTSAALAATGVGIVFAVGMDIIFGAINGAQERDQLQSYIDKLDGKLKIVQGYKNSVNTRSESLKKDAVVQFDTFKGICTDMFKIVPADHIKAFKYDYPSSIDQEDNFIAAQTTALNTFGLLLQLRTTYEKAKVRNPHVTKDTVVNAVLLTAPDWCDYDTLVKVWDNVLAKYSDAMKNAA